MILGGTLLLLMDDILHNLGAPKYRNSQDFRDLRCKISAINSMFRVGGFENWTDPHATKGLLERGFRV